MLILPVAENELEEILKLQYAAYRSEAELLGDFNIQPLTETLDELRLEFLGGKIYKAVSEDGAIIGSVRGYTKNGTLHIGKLMVLPEYRCRGIGSELLLFIEEDNRELRKELFTSDRSVNNLKLYEGSGYVRFKTVPVSEKYNLVYLEKK